MTVVTKKYEAIVDLGDLTGPEGNAFCILGRVEKALRGAGVPDKDIAGVMKQARRGNYDHLLEVVDKSLTVHGDSIANYYNYMEYLEGEEDARREQNSNSQ